MQTNRDESLLHFIRSCPVFSTLDQETCEGLLSKFEKLNLSAEEVLYYQGDLSGDLYILLNGKLSTMLTMVSGDTKTVSYIEPGEMVGEIGVLSNEPRTFTVKAMTESTVLKLTGENFIELCHKFPSVMFSVIKPLVKHSQKIFQMVSPEKIGRHILIIAGNKEIPLEIFHKNFSQCLDSSTHVVLLSDFDSELSSAQVIKNRLEEAEAREKPKPRIVFLVKTLSSELAKLAAKKFDRVYIVGDNKRAAYIEPGIFELIQKRESHLKSKTELILLQEEFATNTTDWLRHGAFAAHHHIRVNKQGDYERLIRFIRGRAVGLVLGGGGTRGWAHLGVIRALHEASIPIDAIGGTSVGAIIGACYALDQNYEKSFQRFDQIFEGSRFSTSWRSLTWPAVSLFNGKNMTNAQREIFKDIRIEELLLPYFCVTSNFGTYADEVHRSGLIWERTRASSAIPGLIPPMVINGDLHFDGGLLNNLPVDAMREIVGKRAKIIAVEIGGNIQRKTTYNFPPELTFAQALLSKFRLMNRDYRFPPFVDMFLKSLLVGSSLRTKQNGLAADLLLSLDLTNFGMIHSSSKRTEKLIEIGYQDTVAQLNKFKFK